MVSAERSVGVDAGLPDWTAELKIRVPVAPVTIEVLYSRHPAVKEAESDEPPSFLKFLDIPPPAWGMSPMRLPDEYSQTHFGVAVIHNRGLWSNFGLALPLGSETMSGDVALEVVEPKPFCFFWNVVPANPEIAPIRRIAVEKGWRKLVEGEEEVEGEVVDIAVESLGVGSDGTRVWRIGHPYVNPLVLKEEYLVKYYPNSDPKDLFALPRLRRALVSGKEGRRHFPFEMLLGRFEPTLVGEGRMLGRDWKRFQGFAGAPAWVF